MALRFYSACQKYLSTVQLEQAQGGQDEEATGALAELKAKMAALAAAEAKVEAGSSRTEDANEGPDDIQLASALDR